MPLLPEAEKITKRHIDIAPDISASAQKIVSIHFAQKELVDFLNGAGVLWKPEHAEVPGEDLVGAIETLYEYCINEKFYYTVVNRQKPDRKMGVRLIDRMKNL